MVSCGILTVVVFMAVLFDCSANNTLECWGCTSAKPGSCRDPFEGDKLLEVVRDKCKDKEVCVKMVYKVDESISRSCAVEGFCSNETHAARLEICEECNTDRCNGGDGTEDGNDTNHPNDGVKFGPVLGMIFISSTLTMATINVIIEI